MILREFFTTSKNYLSEGGNVAIGGAQAQQINLQVTNRSYIIPILDNLLKEISANYQANYQAPLWNPKLIKNKNFLSGSSLHFFNVKGIPDKVFVEKKPKVGDIDTMVDKNYESNLEKFLTKNTNQFIGNAKLLGFQRGNEQYSSLWELQDPPIKVQIDLEFVDYEKDEPTPWARFSHSSSWDDLNQGVKGVFHKFLIQSFGVLTKRQFILRKQEGRGKNRQWVDVPAEDSMLSFAVSSKEGGGLRAKYTPVTNPATGEPEMKDELPVMMALPAAGYEKDIGKIFQSLFGVRLDDKKAKKLADQFWSFTGLLSVMNQLLDKEEKSRVLGSFINKIFGKGAQGLYKNDPDRDIAEKSTALNLMLSSLKVDPPEGMDIEQLKSDYKAGYKMTEEIVDEADDITAPAKPNYARQGIKHIYNRLPDGRISSMEMSNTEFQQVAREIADNGGNLDGMSVNLKVDGAGIRFGKDESGRPFMMTSKVTTPLYADNVGYFTDYGRQKGQDTETLARTQKYDDALSLITNSKFIQTLPNDTIVQAEMMYVPMAQTTDQGLKFVNISYDPKKLGREMTLVPFMVKQYSTGDERPDADKIIQRLTSASDKNVKIVTNRLEQKGINVSKIIQPILDLDPKSKESKPAFDTAKQAFSDAVINSPNLKGKDSLGKNMEGIVVNLPSGRLFKVTSSTMKAAMAAKSATGEFGDTKPRTAVVAIGNFAGHKGHEQLINFAIEKANELGGTPFVFVGHKVGPDDPIDINTKLETLKKLYPNVTVSVVQNQIDPATGTETAGNIFKKIEYELIKKQPFYNNIIITVGSDQAGLEKTAAQMQNRYSKFPPLSHVKVSVYVTPRKSDEGGTGVSTTQLRNALKTMPENQAFQVWSQAYNVQKLGADWIRHLMDVARKHMGIQSKPVQQPAQIQPQTAPVMESFDFANDQTVSKKSGLVADALYNMNPRLFKRFGDEYLMDLIHKVVRANPNDLVKNIINSVVRELRELVETELSEKMMPKSNFAGTGSPWHHKLGRPAQKMGKDKSPVRAGDFVGGDAQESVQKDPLDPITSTVINFYKPVVGDIHKEKVDNYIDQANELLGKTNDPSIKSKLVSIFKKGKENPYIQGGIVTTVGALLAGGVLSSAQRLGLNPAQTNLALQAILNTVIPTVVSRINGKNWTDTIKYTLASAGIGTGIAGAGLVEEKSQDTEFNYVPVSEDVEQVMSKLIEKIIVNEAIQNKH